MTKLEEEYLLNLASKWWQEELEVRALTRGFTPEEVVQFKATRQFDKELEELVNGTDNSSD